MGNGFAGSVQLDSYFVQQVQYSISPVEYSSGLLVALDIMLGFPLQLPIDSFILQNLSETPVDFLVQNFVLLKQFKMVAFKGVSLKHQTIVLPLCLTHYAFGAL